MHLYTDDQLSAYLKHIGHEHDVSTVKKLATDEGEDALACLTRLQILHMARVPFESLSLHYSRYRQLSLDPEELFEKVVGRGRGGYCMEVNTFFATILRSFGFRLVCVGGRVKVPGLGYKGWDHMVNLVTLANNERYLVDVGFGSNGPPRPIPLIDGHQFTGIAPTIGKLEYRNLEEHTDPNQRVWVYSTQENPHAPWFEWYHFVEIEFMPADFEVMNLRTSTSPQSFFVQSVMCMTTVLDEERKEPVGLVILHRDYVKKRMGEKSEIVEKLENEEQRVEALEKYFGVELTPREQMAIRGLASELRFKGHHA